MAKVKYSEFVDALDAAATLDGTETVVVIQDGAPVETTTQDIADLGGGAAAYLVYTALLTQTGTDAPVATVLQNTLSGAIVWTRGDVGEYTGTLAGAFTANKTWFSITCRYDNAYIAQAFLTGTDSFGFYVNGLADTPVDEWTNISVEIRVYL